MDHSHEATVSEGAKKITLAPSASSALSHAAGRFVLLVFLSRHSATSPGQNCSPPRGALSLPFQKTYSKHIQRKLEKLIGFVFIKK